MLVRRPTQITSLGDTYLVEFTPTHQPRHFIPGFIFLEANNTLLFLSIRIDAILLRRNEGKQAARSMTHSITIAGAFAGVAHAACALGG
jgi:hypothetical protein